MFSLSGDPSIFLFEPFFFFFPLLLIFVCSYAPHGFFIHPQVALFPSGPTGKFSNLPSRSPANPGGPFPVASLLAEVGVVISLMENPPPRLAGAFWSLFCTPTHTAVFPLTPHRHPNLGCPTTPLFILRKKSPPLF